MENKKKGTKSTCFIKGICIGIIFGVIFDRLGLGLSVGAACGLLFDDIF